MKNRFSTKLSSGFTGESDDFSTRCWNNWIVIGKSIQLSLSALSGIKGPQKNAYLGKSFAFSMVPYTMELGKIPLKYFVD